MFELELTLDNDLLIVLHQVEMTLEEVREVFMTNVEKLLLFNSW